MRAVPPRAAPLDPAPYASAEAVFAETKAYLSSREAQQMSESDLERELNRRGQELMRKLLQGPGGGGRGSDAGSGAPGPRARQALGRARRRGRDAARPGGSGRLCVRRGGHGDTRHHPRAPPSNAATACSADPSKNVSTRCRNADRRAARRGVTGRYTYRSPSSSWRTCPFFSRMRSCVRTVDELGSPGSSSRTTLAGARPRRKRMSMICRSRRDSRLCHGPSMPIELTRFRAVPPGPIAIFITMSRLQNSWVAARHRPVLPGEHRCPGLPTGCSGSGGPAAKPTRWEQEVSTCFPACVGTPVDG